MERGAGEMSESRRRRRCWPEEEREKMELRESFCTGGMGGKKRGGKWERRELKEGCGPAVGPHPKKPISNVAHVPRY